jgi:erythrin-vacuolar iron transport family protein
MATTLDDQRSFLLQRAQPAMAGLIDGSLSTLAPIFAVAFATHQSHYAFLAGLATAVGAGVSMAFSEGLSDTGDVTGRGRPYLRGAITGAGTFLGGVLHTLPFLIPQYRSALVVAVAVIALELLALAWLRRWFFRTRFVSSLVSVTLGGVIIAAISVVLGQSALRPRAARRRRWHVYGVRLGAYETTVGLSASSHHWRKLVGVEFCGVRWTPLSRPSFFAQAMSVYP